MPLSPRTFSTSARGLGTVLVVDDDADMRLYIAGCLRMMGTGVVLDAADGEQALQMALETLPDLIISDIVMPGMGGVALCRALHADARTAAIPLLFVSGETRAPPSCASGFLAKPFNATSLRTQIERVLARPV